jgi:tRNA(fMet)-specific endonuclease VapC
MTGPSTLLLLDTSVVLHVVRGDAVAKRMDQAYNLRGRAERPLISVVTVGEGRSFAIQRGWGSAKVETLDRLLHEFVVVDINNAAVLDKYAQIDAQMKKNGRALGKNDVWIAATAAVTGALLLTNDKDFAPLDPLFLAHAYVDPNSD